MEGCEPSVKKHPEKAKHVMTMEGHTVMYTDTQRFMRHTMLNFKQTQVAEFRE